MPGLRVVLEVLDAAALELEDNAAWYEQRVTGLGDRFVVEVEEAFTLIESRPSLGSPWLLKGIPEGVRHVPLHSFPFSVVYVLDPRVVVIAIAHGSTRPLYWIERLSEMDRNR